MQRRNVTCDPFLAYNGAMVDPNMPWSLKGISDEAREFAKLASDQSDIPVGVWLSQVIRAAATSIDSVAPEVAPPEIVPPPTPTPTPVPDPGPRSSTIERAAQIVDDFGFEPEGPARDDDLIEDPDLLQAKLQVLERRLQNAEAGTRDNLAPLMDEIERLRARLSGSGRN
jgi:hypothetical protein